MELCQHVLFLFYGRAGYTNGHFQTITSDASLANVNKRFDGFRWGLGGKQSISEHFAIRMEYSQVHYEQVNIGTFDVLSPVTKTTQIRPFQQLVEFGLVYTV